MLPAFWEGMARVAQEGTRIYDGREQTYGVRDEWVYRYHRHVMMQSRDLFRDKSLFDKFIGVGYANWISIGGWDKHDSNKNYFTPTEWQTSLYHALSYTDEYVWIYTQMAHWWNDDVSEEYRQAQRNAYREPGRAQWPLWHGRVGAAYQARQLDNVGEFDDLLASYDDVHTLPAQGWLFRYDPDMVGEDQSWYATTIEDTNRWITCEIQKFWEEYATNQGIYGLVAYDGLGWYRRNFTCPEIADGKRIKLVFGAVDDGAIVWVNGEKAGEFLEPGAWNKRFMIDVTKQIKPGQDNQITVQVHDRSGAGGIWRAIKVMVEE
jgi:hypothetical protein